MRALSEEIARMTATLERLRELHKRGEAFDLRGDVDAGRKQGLSFLSVARSYRLFPRLLGAEQPCALR